MKNIIKRYGIQTYINAHDTITRYGGSRMSLRTLQAMAEISPCFVDLDSLQATLGKQLAALTNNQDAYICAGAASGILLCTAVFLSRGEMNAYLRLPKVNERNEIVVQHSQHICYDKAIEAAGGHIKLVGNSDGVTPDEFRDSLGANTAGVFCFPSIKNVDSSLPVWKVVEIAHEKGIPVAVDAAALLPPRKNLWAFTRDQGADMAIFSGGKTLCGPQASGLIVGKTQYVEYCRQFGAPKHGICRTSKATREDMVGLRVAVEEFFALDENEVKTLNAKRVDKLIHELAGWKLGKPRRVEHGSVGQDYPRVFLDMSSGYSTAQVIRAMEKKGVFIGEEKGSLYISPQGLSDDEVNTVIEHFNCVADEIIEGDISS